VKYSRIFTNIKTGYEYYNWLFFFLYFLEQQSPSYCKKQLFTAGPARSAAMPVLFLLSGPKIGGDAH